MMQRGDADSETRAQNDTSITGGFALSAAIVVAVSVVVNIGYRGPFFGLAPFAIFSALPALVAAYLLSRLRSPRPIVVAISTTISLGLSWLLAAPPSTEHLFKEILATPMPAGTDVLQRWNDNWARDPSYYLRFPADTQFVEQIAWNTHITPVASAPPEFRARPAPVERFLLPVPGWWDVPALRDPQVWRGVWNGHGIELIYDPPSGHAYVTIDTF